MDKVDFVLVGSEEPVGFFAYPDKPSLMKPNGSIVHRLALPEEDVPGALEALAAELVAAPVPPPRASPPEPAHGPVTPAAVAQTLVAPDSGVERSGSRKQRNEVKKRAARLSRPNTRTGRV